MKDEIKQFFKGDVENAPDVLTKYSHDASLFEVRPEIVVFPRDAEDIKNLMKWVNEKSLVRQDLTSFQRSDLWDGKLSITARAAGTCMAGGPLGESIILDTTRYMNKILHIEKYSKEHTYKMRPMFAGAKDISISGEATVEPGVFYRNFEKATLEHDLLLPCYTASKSINAVGGMVGNNSGGELTLKYGKTEDYVAELKAVFVDGNEYTIRPLTRHELDLKMAQNDFEGDIYKNLFELIQKNEDDIKNAKPKVTKNSAGYTLWNVWDEKTQTFDLPKLIVGSQGTLAITTEITFRLVEPLKNSALLVIFMYELNSLGSIVNDALSANPESIEAYDDKTIKLAVRFWYGFIKKRGLWGAIKLGISFLPELGMIFKGMPKLVILVNCAGNNQTEVKNKINNLSTLFVKYKNIKTRKVFSAAEADKYWTIRRDSFALLREHFQNKRTAPFIDDVVVPVTVLPKFLPKITEILDRNKLIYNMHGHAASGNFHIIPLLTAGDSLNKDLIMKVSDEVYSLVIDMHGSITGEHNDGIIRTPFLSQMYSPKIINIFQEIKNIFDPKNILNPGKKVGGSKEYIKSHLAK